MNLKLKVLRGLFSVWLKGNSGSLNNPGLIGKIFIRLPSIIVFLYIGIYVSKYIGSEKILLPIIFFIALIWNYFTNSPEGYGWELIWRFLVIVGVLGFILYIVVYNSTNISRINLLIFTLVAFILWDVFCSITQYFNIEKFHPDEFSLFCKNCGWYMKHVRHWSNTTEYLGGGQGISSRHYSDKYICPKCARS